MIELIEVAERARTGPRLDEKEWNMMLFRKMQELTKKYDLRCRGVEEFINTDDSLADDAFRAAIDFIVDMGAYCITTNRVIHFEEGEVRKAAREAPKQVLMGEGKDARVFKQGKVDGCEPININPGHHAPFTEDLGSLVVKNFAQIPRADFIEGFNFPAVDGREVYGQPFEAYAAIREVAWMREGVRKAGRPGMAIVLYPISTRASALTAPKDPDLGLRRTDGLLMSTLPDVKVEYDHITTAIVFSSYGYFAVNGSFGMVGGFCGGVEGAMVETIAKAIAAWMVYRDVFQYGGSVSGPEGLTARWTPEMEARLQEEPTFRMPIWPTYVVHRALSRNTNIIRFGGIGGRAGVGGIGSEAELLSIARGVIASTVMGCNLVCTTGGNPTPYHVEFQAQVSDATVKAGIRREEVKDLMERVDSIVRERLRGAPLVGYGDRRMLAYKDFERYFKPMREMFNFIDQKPSKVLIENARKTRKVLADLGLDLEAAATRM